MKSANIRHVPPNDVIRLGPVLRLVQSGVSRCSEAEAFQPGNISDHVGLSHPKEIEPSSSETTKSEKSPAHLKAIEAVTLLRDGLITATDLRKQYPKEYKNWDDMKQRCKGNPKNGLPPIPLDQVFLKFPDFLEVMGPRPHPTWSLDRVSPTGPYSPDNVRWASKTTQSRNRTNAVYLTYRGVTRLLVEWAEWLDESPAKFRQRERNGWSDEEIIEGHKAVVLYNQSTPQPSRDFWAFTPWPKEHREQLEHFFQCYGLAGEHRLEFAKRYIPDCARKIREHIDQCCWPDYYIPTPAEIENIDKLTREHDRWLLLYRDIMTSLSEEFRTKLYRTRHLPEWVEEKLSAYA
jgi:hypothetical protein